MKGPYLTLSGVVGSDPELTVINDSVPVTNFRLGATTRRYDRSAGGWVDGETTWVTVTCFRALARNVAKSVARRDRLVVHGRLRVRNWRQDDGHPRQRVEVEADSIGHDLTFGTSVFVRSPRFDRSGLSGEATEGGPARSGADDEIPTTRDRLPVPTEAALPTGDPADGVTPDLWNRSLVTSGPEGE